MSFIKQDDVGYVKKKREYKKRKHKHSINQQNVMTSRPQLPHYTEVVPNETTFSSEDDGISPVGLSILITACIFLIYCMLFSVLITCSVVCQLYINEAMSNLDTYNI